MINIFHNTRQKLFIFFLFISFFGFTQKRYELRVKAKVVQDSLLVDLEVSNTGNTPFDIGVGQFVFGFVDTVGIDFSAGKVVQEGEFSGPTSTCYNASVFAKFKTDKYVNFQVNRKFSSGGACPVSIGAGVTKKLATLYFPITDCSKSIEFQTPSGTGDARVDWTGQDIENDLGFKYDVTYMPAGLLLNTNQGYSLKVNQSSICSADTLKMIIANTKGDASLKYRFYKQGVVGPKVLLSTQSGADTLYKSFGEVLNSEDVFIEVDNGTSCVFTTTSETISVSSKPKADFTYVDTCLGEVTNFTNNSTSVVTSTNYQWTFGEGAASSMMNNPTHTYSDKGKYSVKLKAINGLCTDSITKTLSIIGVNKPNLGGDTASCSGGAITLSPSTIVGYTFDWKESSQIVFGNTGNSFVANSAGDYIVRADSSGIGCYAYDTVKVSYNTLGTINFPKDTSVCNGVALNYNLSVPATASVEWKDNTAGTLFSNNSMFSYSGSSGSTSIKVKVSDGGCSDSSVFSITKVSGISVITTPVVGQLDPNTLEFKWEKVLGAADYKVTYTINSVPTMTGFSIGSDTSYVINNLALGGNIDTVSFFFEATGANASCGSATSPTVEQVIGTCVTMPAQTMIDSAKVQAVTATTLSFIWDEVVGAVGYEVQYSINGGVATAFQAIGADTSYTITGLTAFDTVTFTYKAFNNCEDRLKMSIAISFDCNTGWSGADGGPYCTSSFNQVLKADVVTPFYRFEGPGVNNSNDTLFYFKPQDAGPGTHTISLIGCYDNDTTSKQVTVNPAPCISTSDTSTLKVPFEKPQAIFTDCNGQIYFSDNIENSVVKIDSFGVAQTLLGVGSGTFGFKDGHVDTALFNQVTGLVVHPTSDVIYFVDGGNHAVRKFDPFTQMITTLAGGGNQQNTGNNGDGGDSDSPTDSDGLQNRIFTTPFGIAFSASYDSLYISDRVNNKIKVLRLADNTVHFVAGSGASGTTDGNFSTATFTELSQINFDQLTNKLYVGTLSSFGSPKIRYLNFNNGQVETMVSGPLGFVMNDGPANVANHLTPIDVAPNGQGDLFIIDKGFCALRVYKADSDSVISLIGTPGSTSNCGSDDISGTKLNEPSALSVFVKGFIDIVDTKNDRILRVSIDDFLNGALSNVDSLYCQFDAADTLKDVSVPGTYTLFPANPNVLYQANGKWVFNPQDTGRYELCFNHKIGACTNNECKEVYVAPLPIIDLGSDTLMCPSQAGNYRIQTKGDTTFSFQWYEKTLSQGIYFTRTDDTLHYTNVLEYGNYVLGSETKYGCKSSDTLVVSQSPDLKIEITSVPGQYSCNEDGARLLTAKISNSPGVRSYLWNTGDTSELISVDKAGNYVVTAQDSIGCIGDTSFLFNIYPTPFVEISTPNKITDVVVKTLVRNNDTLVSPYGMVEDSKGNIFITDDITHVILKYEKQSKKLSVFAGERYQSGYRDGASAWFNQPKGISIDTLDNLYVADEFNNVIRKITPSGIVSTFIGQFYTSGVTHRDTINTFTRFNKPTGIALNGTGDFIIADKGNNVVRMFNVANKEVHTIGVPNLVGQSVDSTFLQAKFDTPSSVYVHQTGGFIVGEKANIRYLNIVSKKVTTIDDGSVMNPENFSGTVLGVSSYGGRNVVSVVDGLNKVLFSTKTPIDITNSNTDALTNVLAGNNNAGYVDSNAVYSEFNGLQGVFIGQNTYVSDAANHAIRTIKDSNYVLMCPGDTIDLTANDGGDYMWKLNNTTVGSTKTIKADKAGTYILEYIDKISGCLAYDSIHVGLYPGVDIVGVINDTTLCMGDSVDLFASTKIATDSIFWYKNTLISSVLSEGIGADTLYSVQFNQADTYYVVASNGTCSDTSQVVVTPSDLALNINTIKDTLCYGDTSKLKLTATSSKGISTYSWNTSEASGYSWPTTLDTDSLMVSPTILGSNKYLVTVKDSNACQITDSISVFLLDSLSVSFSKDTMQLCAGGTIEYVTAKTIGGKPNYSYQWIGSGVAGLSLSPSSDSVGLVYNGDTSLVTYVKVKIIDANNCTKEDSVRVELKSFEIEAIAQYDTVCPNTSNTLNVNVVEGGVGPYSYTWSPSLGLSNSGIQSPISLITTNQKYNILMYDSTTKCSANDSLSIVVRSLNALVGNKGIDTSYVCANDTFLLDASKSNGGTKPYTFAWTKINGNDMGATSPTVNVDDTLKVYGGSSGSTSLYQVNVSDGIGCSDRDTITLIWNNEVKLSLSVDSLVGCVNNTDSVKVTNLSGGVMPYDYSWTVSKGTATTSCVACDTTLITYTNRDTSDVILTVTDSVGCKAIDTVSVRSYELLVDAKAVLGQVCTGVSDTLGVAILQDSVGKQSIAWSPSIYLDDAGVRNPVATISSPQSFVVVVRDSLTGCVAEDSVSITIKNISAVIDHASLQQDTLIVCFGSSPVLLNATKTSGGSPNVNSPYYSYNWTSSVSNVSIPDQTLDTVKVSNSQTDTNQVFLEVKDRVGCTAQDSIVLVWNDELKVSIAGKTYLCQGDTLGVKAIVSGGISGYTLVWNEVNTNDGIELNLLTAQDTVNVISTSSVGKDTVVVNVTDKAGCKVNDSLAISLSQLEANLSLDNDTICSGFDVTAKAVVTAGVGPYGYNWQNTTYGISDTLKTTISSSQSIQMDLIDSTTNCMTTKSINVVVENISLSINTDDKNKYHCFEDSLTIIQLSPITGGNKNYINSSWTNNGSVVQSTSTDLNLIIDDNNLSDSNIVIFSIEDTKGCKGSDTVTVYRNNQIIVNRATISDVCIGDSTALNATTATGGTSTNYTYLWSASEGDITNTSSLSTSYKSSNSGTKTITLRATDNGYPVTCSGISRQSVEVKALPVILFNDTTYCKNQTLVVDLSDNGNVYSGSETVVWKFNNNLISPTDDHVAINGVGTLQVTVTDGGCTDSLSKTIDTLAVPQPNIILPNSVCNSDSVKLKGSFVGLIDSFSWDENGQSKMTDTTKLSTAYLPNLDNGYVRFTLKGINRCGTKSITDSVLVNQNPIPKINISDTVVLKGTTLTYNALTSGNNLQHNWTFTQVGGNRTELGAGPISVDYIEGVKLPTQYKVTNTLTKCEGQITIFVTIFDQVVFYIPNVFSPSAENAENKVFKIYGENIKDEDFALTIYNRWGQEVFNSTSLIEMKQDGWDGESELAGVYTYTLKMKLSDGELVEKVGNITLIK